jgi:hypothetical protein
LIQISLTTAIALVLFIIVRFHLKLTFLK